MNSNHIQQIFAHYIDKFEEINNTNHQEYYKWQIIKRFRDEMDAAISASADEFPSRLYNIKKLSYNLIDSYTQPFQGLVHFAEKEPETVREMFLSLYSDDGGNLAKRQEKISEFLKKSHELRDKYYPDSYLYRDDMHSVTGYLFLYDPDHNYIFKATHAQIFADCVEFYDDWGSGDSVKIDVYYRMCDQIVEAIKSSPEMMVTDASRFDNGWGVDPDTLYSDPEKHILAFDLIYCCSTYGLFNGITFARPKSKERQLILERKEKAIELSIKMEEARRKIDELEAAKKTINSIFAEGVTVRQKKFGEGIIRSNNGSVITVDFPEDGEKQLGTFISISNGLISAQGDDTEEFRACMELVKKENLIKSGLIYAEKEFAPFAEYLDINEPDKEAQGAGEDPHEDEVMPEKEIIDSLVPEKAEAVEADDDEPEIYTERSEIKLETKLVSEIEGTFYVPSYQRGYRWGKDEVLRLLDDVLQNGKNNYCLQPIVVRKTEDSYELIDGQQRLTTLYLIYRYMRDIAPMFYNEPAFNLIYETRENSQEFLKSIDLSRREENIDFWFIANAYETIKKWFEEDMQIRVQHIFEYFKEDVKVIWYEVGENEDAISLFTRLNIGKIPLTSAELVKAMFLSSSYKDRVSMEKQEEISLQWDNMEKELHDDSLWYFLTNRTSVRYQTRIDLILDLISEKPVDNREKYYTFFKIDEMGKTMSLEDLWRKIQQTFLILKDWFENHELYHKIGYLVASEKLTLQEIFKGSVGKTKQAFRALLDSFIRESVAIQGNYADLSYDKPFDYKRISTLLLLFNVESVRLNGEHTQWFPFDKFKFDGKGKIAWSLEHIHAQQSEGLQTQEMWKEWLGLHMPSVQAVSGDTELVEAMRAAIDAERLERTDFEELQQRVIGILSVQGNSEYMHSISNLALLRASDNAALNNSTFDVKRNMIIEMDKEGQYIPFCTKMVFLKYYTPSADNQLHFWGQSDRAAYVGAMNKVLGPYLSEPIAMAEEE